MNSSSADYLNKADNKKIVGFFKRSFGRFFSEAKTETIADTNLTKHLADLNMVEHSLLYNCCSESEIPSFTNTFKIAFAKALSSYLAKQPDPKSLFTQYHEKFESAVGQVFFQKVQNEGLALELRTHYLHSLFNLGNEEKVEDKLQGDIFDKAVTLMFNDIVKQGNSAPRPS